MNLTLFTMASLRAKSRLCGCCLLLGLLGLVSSVQTVLAHPGSGFIPNAGQWQGDFLYKTQSGYATVMVREQSLQYVLLDGKILEAYHHHHQTEQPLRAHSVRMVFENSSRPSDHQPEGAPHTTRYNFYLGQDTSRWKTGLRAYPGVRLQNLYPGVDLQLRSDSGLKYNLLADRPGLLEQVRIHYQGADSLKLDDGALMIYTSLGVIREAPPVAWQTHGDGGRTLVNIRYVLEGERVHFEVSSNAVASKRPLVVDPEIVFATYSGSRSDNWGLTATYDEDGYGYTGGMVFGDAFPNTAGAFQMNFAGGQTLCQRCPDIARDGALMRFSPDGSELMYATYFGGSHNEQPHSMVVNSRNELIVFGTTRSFDFPVRDGYDEIHNGQDDIVVMRLDEQGRLLSSTYLGGSRADGMNGNYSNGYDNNHALSANYGDVYRGEVKVDEQDQVWIASTTRSSPADGFPLRNAFQGRLGGGLNDQDGCLIGLSQRLDNLVYSSYLGGSGLDAAYSLDIRPGLGEVVLTGGTTSRDFPATEGAYQTSSRTQEAQDGSLRAVDGWVALVKPEQRRLAHATYISSSQYDQLYFVKRDQKGSIFVTGQSRADWAASSSTYSNQGAGQLIFELTDDLSRVRRLMEFGNPDAPPENNISLVPSAFMVDSCGRVFLSGWGGASNQIAPVGGSTVNLPLTQDAVQTETDGSDFYIAVFNNNLSNLLYGTYLGGPFSNDHVDGGTSRFDPRRGFIYQSICAGCGGRSDFPVTEDAWSSRNQAPNCNNLLVKFDVNLPNSAPQTSDQQLQVETGELLTFDALLEGAENDPIVYEVTGLLTDTAGEQPPVQVEADTLADGRIRLRFSWRSNCQASLGSPYFLQIRLHDLGCPFFSDTTYANIRIDVTPSPNGPPYLLEDNKSVTVTAGDTLEDMLRIRDREMDGVFFEFRESPFPSDSLPPPYPDPLSGMLADPQDTLVSWVTTCDHEGSWPFELYLQDDDRCPEPLDSSFSRTYRVLRPAPPDPFGFVCVDSVDNGSIRIHWEHPDTASLEGILVLRKVDDQPFRMIDSVAPYSSFYWDAKPKLGSYRQLCYRLIPVGSCHVRGDSSYRQCVGPDVAEDLRSGYIYQTTVEDDEFIRLQWQASSVPDYYAYELFRSRGFERQEWESLGRITRRQDTQYVDRRVFVDSMSYCYRLVTYTYCSLPLDGLNEGCSIHLEGESQPFLHTLSWNPYEQWPQGVRQYEVQRRYGRDSTFSRLDLRRPEQRTYKDNRWDYDWGRYEYRIRAEERPNDFYTATSTSNEITLNQPPRVRIPNAFSPNGDGLNETFKLRTLFVRSFHLRIYNRWGALVYETRDEDQSWDGAIDDLTTMDNVFIYQVNYVGWDGLLRSTSGNVTVIR